MNAVYDTQPNGYIYLIETFAESIRQHSARAATCIEQIHARFGPRTAYLAAFAVLVLTEWRDEQCYTPSKNDLSTFPYYEEMRDNPDAMQLYEEAASYLMPDIKPTDRSSVKLHQ